MVLLFIGLITVLISLHKIGYTLNVILQVVSIGIQRSGLVRTPEQVRADAEAAEEEEIPFHEIPEE